MSNSHACSHSISVRVYYEDTDAGGIVYYANYLRFFERGRTEMLRDLGIDQSAYRKEHGLIFAVRSCHIDYLAPARLDDWLQVITEIRSLGASRLDMAQTIRHQERILTMGRITVVAIGADGRPKRIPEDLRHLLLPLVVPEPQNEGTR